MKSNTITVTGNKNNNYNNNKFDKAENNSCSNTGGCGSYKRSNCISQELHIIDSNSSIYSGRSASE